MTNSSTHSAHPLDMIPLFRRWPASTPRNLVYTALWSSLIGLALAAAGGAHVLGLRLLQANAVGFLIHGALSALRLSAPAAFARRAWTIQACKLLLMACAGVLGLALPDLLLHATAPSALLAQGGALAPLLPLGVVIALLMVVVLATSERRVARATEAARQQELIAETGRLLAEARLRALQAQIEPHFLYNTLANVVSLIGPDPDRARHMLERLIDFLRASLAASRAEHATVGAEFDQARAYLDVLAVRLGERLRYRVEAAADVRALALAPMLVQPLVENAVMHGIEPQVAGGEIVVRARREGDRLCIEVADDGAGLAQAAPRPGDGVGLSNLRERLRSLHGPDARLQLLENQPGGVTARLLLPLPQEPA